jgi:glycosyltransferase involved in cell wall biosynthesis
MTVYSDLRFIETAAASILAQTFQDFEFIIVNDGAGALDVFDRVAAQDARIQVVTNVANTGAMAAANLGIRGSVGDIIARLDADDIAKPNWIESLVAALDADPDLGLVGANLVDIDETGAKTRSRAMPESDIAIRWAMLFCNPFCHSSVCFRRTCYDRAGGYHESWRATGDYEFWFRMLWHCRAANVQQELTEYRVNPRGVTAAYRSTWRERNDPLRERAWAQLGASYEPAIADALSAFVLGFDLPATELRSPSIVDAWSCCNDSSLLHVHLPALKTTQTSSAWYKTPSIESSRTPRSASGRHPRQWARTHTT